MRRWIHVAVISAFASAAAQAHTELSSSMPADKAVLSSAPQQVMLHFSEPVRLTSLSLGKASGGKQDLGPLPAESNANFSVAAPELTAGDYVVAWRALSKDSHVMTGEFAFKVDPSAPPTQQRSQEHPEGHSQPHAQH